MYVSICMEICACELKETVICEYGHVYINPSLCDYVCEHGPKSGG